MFPTSGLPWMDNPSHLQYRPAAVTICAAGHHLLCGLMLNALILMDQTNFSSNYYMLSSTVSAVESCHDEKGNHWLSFEELNTEQ